MNAEERALAARVLPASVRRPMVRPSTLVDRWSETAVDPPVSIEIDVEGRVFVPFVTAALLPWLCERHPALRPRLAYLDRHAR